MSKIDYQALREAAQLATQGEWVAFISSGTGTYAVHTPGDKRCEDVIKWTGFDGQNNAENNARYIAAFNPEVVLALLDERERNQQYIKRRDQENEDIALTVGKLRVELEAVQKTSAARIEAIDRTHKMFQREKDRADAAEKCIAELSASHSKLRDTMAGIHNTIRMDGGYTPLAAILNAAKRAYEESASAAGIRIKGE
ncbi:ead/Ea22-like family protein [Escherichia coli]|nr:ead/Ea22-like family protein [Escherichia coli]EKH1302395.1 ead/Ea22-like family protein [Escherichia coli]HEC5140272.1 ead/Ea22-like family protein [Escherichia coli]